MSAIVLKTLFSILGLDPDIVLYGRYAEEKMAAIFPKMGDPLTIAFDCGICMFSSIYPCYHPNTPISILIIIIIIGT